MPKTDELTDTKNTLLSVNDHVIGGEAEDFMKVCFMLMIGAAGD